MIDRVQRSLDRVFKVRWRTVIRILLKHSLRWSVEEGSSLGVHCGGKRACRLRFGNMRDPEHETRRVGWNLNFAYHVRYSRRYLIY